MFVYFKCLPLHIKLIRSQSKQVGDVTLWELQRKGYFECPENIVALSKTTGIQFSKGDGANPGSQKMWFGPQSGLPCLDAKLGGPALL